MTFNSSILELKKLHQEFADNPYFSVFSLMTHRDDWLWIDKMSSNLDGKRKEAKRGQIFNLVVKEDGRTVGSINVKELRGRNWRESIIDIDDYSISSSLSLFDTVSRMVKDSENLERERSPLYFVRDSESRNGEPVGVATFWDLNRAPSYILSYSILVYLEHTLLLEIKDSHEVWCEHGELLNRIRDGDRHGHIRRFLGGQSYDYRSLSKWGLPELLTFYKIDPHISKDTIEISDDLIASFSDGGKFRDRVGHSVKLLVDDNEEFHSDLRRLSIIWNSGKTAFVSFIDPKVRHSSPILRGKLIR